MVGGHRYAKLDAATTGTKTPNEPRWSGFENASSFDGQEHALWKGSSGSTATATATAGSASVSVEIIDPSKQPLEISAEKSGQKDVEREVTSWLSSYDKKPSWSVKGAIKGSRENVDFYGDGEKTGFKDYFGGSVTFGYAKMEVPLPSVPLAGGAIQLKPKVAFDGFQVTFKLSFQFDQSKKDPWVARPEGELSGSAGLTIGGTVQAGPDFVNVSVSGEASSDINASGAVRLSGTHIELANASLNAGNFSLTFEVTAQITILQATIYEASGTWPESGGVLNWNLGNPIRIWEL
jgi:hypothetical protein